MITTSAWLVLATLALAQEPQTFPLWAKGAPGAVGETDPDKPSLTVYLPAQGKSNGSAVVVCPGGGYGGLAMGHEGKDIAAFLNQLGVSAFVLKYRLAPRYKHPSPMLDAQRAIRTVRSRAEEFKIDGKKIGIWGFSAGGHLASTAGTQFDAGKADSEDPIERASCRPDFLILSYPVITLEPPFAHMGSRYNLLGKDADAKLVASLCNHTRVTAQTPPTFLFHTDADTGVPPENSVLFYLALKKHKVPAELHIYEKGRHGVGLAPNEGETASWPGRLQGWLKVHGILGKEELKR
ncbi:MAG: alpha/beta hydrolase [Gemmataceae bacterium]|nr:alpha/beta hydrolase [Gemmataceae bacterium]